MAINVENLGTFTIDGVTYKNLGREMIQSANIKSYRTSPTRTNDFTMPNLPTRQNRIIPRVSLGFKYIKVEDFIRLRKQLLMRSEYVITYFDVDFGKMMTHRMHIEPDEEKAFFNRGSNVLGVFGYTLKFVGSMNGEKSFSVIYDINGGTEKVILPYSSTTSYSYGDVVTANGVYYMYVNSNTKAGQSISNTEFWAVINNEIIQQNTYKWGEMFIVSDYSKFYQPPEGKKFKGYCEDPNGEGAIINVGEGINIFDNTTLYAIWVTA